GMVEAAHDIEERRLARPVRPDDREDLARVHIEAHLSERVYGAEADADVIDLEEGCLAGLAVRRSRRRLGRGAMGPQRLGAQPRAHAVAPPEYTSASRIRTSARTVPLRPSS